jgi:lipopolysaccharide/colanic/teichoic acid biosynthesis glycosyltransferase
VLVAALAGRPASLSKRPHKQLRSGIQGCGNPRSDQFGADLVVKCGDRDVQKAQDLFIFYIRNWSIWLDRRIIRQTLPALFATKGERVGATDRNEC